MITSEYNRPLQKINEFESASFFQTVDDLVEDDERHDQNEDYYELMCAMLNPPSYSASQCKMNFSGTRDLEEGIPIDGNSIQTVRLSDVSTNLSQGQIGLIQTPVRLETAFSACQIQDSFLDMKTQNADTGSLVFPSGRKIEEVLIQKSESKETIDSLTSISFFNHTPEMSEVDKKDSLLSQHDYTFQNPSRHIGALQPSDHDALFNVVQDSFSPVESQNSSELSSFLSIPIDEDQKNLLLHLSQDQDRQEGADWLSFSNQTESTPIHRQKSNESPILEREEDADREGMIFNNEDRLSFPPMELRSHEEPVKTVSVSEQSFVEKEAIYPVVKWGDWTASQPAHNIHIHIQSDESTLRLKMAKKWSELGYQLDIEEIFRTDRMTPLSMPHLVKALDQESIPVSVWNQRWGYQSFEERSSSQSREQWENHSSNPFEFEVVKPKNKNRSITGLYPSPFWIGTVAVEV